MASRGFEDLEVWQASRKLVVDLYQLTSLFPTTEQYGLTSQMRRAVVSIGSNIAEGSARSSRKDFSRFLSMALGSAAELKSQIINVQDLGFTNSFSTDALISDLQKIGRMLKSLHRSMSGEKSYQPSTINHQPL
jgi:four helix bundle protein